MQNTSRLSQASGLMNWYPCIRRGADRWWLPRLPETTELLTLVLLKPHSGATDQLRELVAHRLINDPPLFLYCALQINQDSVGLETLADWLIDHAGHQFSSGDAFLSAPPSSPAGERQVRRLTDHYLDLPLDRWIEDAGLWLEAFGPKVPASWKQTWPTLSTQTREVIQRSNRSAALPVTDPLQVLARVTEHHRHLEKSFAATLHESKLEAITQLAYGLSHEINNPLANISARAEMLLRHEQDSRQQELLQRIVDQVYRAHEMIADLMFFSNPPGAQIEPCDGAEIIRDVIASFDQQAHRQEIRIQTSLQASNPWHVDAKMIGEAIRVLIRNAIEAIGQGGTIVVSTTTDDSLTQIHVADSGPGLSAEARSYAFDPYFSGREAGRGLGLGLCRAYRIARLHDAEIALASGPAGCVATITLGGGSPPDDS